MGNGLHARKLTNKEEKIKREAFESALQQFEEQFKRLSNWVGGNFAQVNQEAAAIRRQVEAIDTRTVAITRLLLKKGLFTDEEIAASLEEVQIDSFNKSVESEDASLGLEPVETGIEAGATYVLSFQTFENGVRNPALSSIRSQIQFGTEQLPKEFEAGVLGLKAGEDKEFEVDAPAAFGPAYNGRKLTFKVHVFAVKKAKPVVEVQSEGTVAGSPVEPA